MRIFSLTIPGTLLLFATAIACFCPVGTAAEIETTYTEPYLEVEVPASEMGVLKELLVREGDAVKKGQILARMDNTVLTSSLEVARAAMEAEGSLRSAEAALQARKKQFDSYKTLRNRGNATQREMDRAENEYIQAQTQLQSVREELEVRRLEYERIRAQLQHRKIVSPINGFVVEIKKEAGEFVSPTDAIVMHVVQIDMLKSVFSVPVSMAANLKAGQLVTMKVGAEKRNCEGVIEFVSPTAEPQSGVRVKIRIPNYKGNIQSGAMCVWDMMSREPKEQMSQHRTPTTR